MQKFNPFKTRFNKQKFLVFTHSFKIVESSISSVQNLSG
jgi:hypothetical protein